MKRAYLLTYFLREALINISRNKVLNAITVAMIAVSLAIFGVFLLAYINLNRVVTHWSDAVQIVAYVDGALSDDDQTRLQAQINEIEAVEAVTFVSPDEALRRLKERMAGHQEVLDGLDGNPLPASFEIRVAPQSRTVTAVQRLAERLQQTAAFTDIQYGQTWLEHLTTVMNMLKFLGVFLGAFLFFTVIFIISNTIKLTLYAREDEVLIMQYLGATEAFIKGPFLVEGIMRGLSGALLSLGVVFTAHTLFLFMIRHSSGSLLALTTVSFFSWPVMAGMIVLGCALGWGGSLLSLRKFLNIA